MISYSQAIRVYQPQMAIHMAMSKASRVYSIGLCGYRTNKMSILGDHSILNTQIYNCEHSETLTRTLSLLNLAN